VGKRSVDIDDELLRQAQELLGTSTVKETVNRALDEAIGLYMRARHADRLARHDGLDLHDSKVMAGAWRRL
jgi:Arc/MetJ family transcription regulator